MKSQTRNRKEYEFVFPHYVFLRQEIQVGQKRRRYLAGRAAHLLLHRLLEKKESSSLWISCQII